MKRRWFYLPATDELFEKTEINWFKGYTMNAPEIWTVFADCEEEARQIIRNDDTKWIEIS